MGDICDGVEGLIPLGTGDIDDAASTSMALSWSPVTNAEALQGGSPRCKRRFFKELGVYCIVGFDGPKYLDDGGYRWCICGGRGRGGIVGDLLSVVWVRVFM